MTADKFNPERFLKKESSRHHYVPRFLIEGFTNQAGLLYVYDKQQDKILKNQRSSKSVFFEIDRNTVETKKGHESSFIEDLWYATLDNECSQLIKYFQVEELARIDFTEERVAKLFFFLITLFWRIPYTDHAAHDVMMRTVISGDGINTETLKNDPTFQKVQRGILFKHTVDEMVKTRTKRRVIANIHQFSSDTFVIGDNPVVFDRVPTFFSEFGELDYLFAVSSTRIFSSTTLPFRGFDSRKAFEYNAAVIAQSMRYVCSSCHEILEQSVRVYRELRRLSLVDFNVKMIFRENEVG